MTLTNIEDLFNAFMGILRTERDARMAAERKLAECERVPSLDKQLTAWQQATGCELPGDAEQVMHESRMCIATLEDGIQEIRNVVYRDALDGSGKSESCAEIAAFIDKLAQMNARHVSLASDELRAWRQATGCETVDEARFQVENLSDANEAWKARITTLEAELKVAREVSEMNGRACVQYVANEEVMVAQIHAANKAADTYRSERDAAQARCAELEREAQESGRILATTDAQATEFVIERNRLRERCAELERERGRLANRIERARAAGSYSDAMNRLGSDCPKPLCIPSEECATECRADPEPRVLTAEEVERHLRAGGMVRIEWPNSTTEYRLDRDGLHFRRRHGDWGPMIEGSVSRLLEFVVQSGSRCTIVTDPEQKQEGRHG